MKVTVKALRDFNFKGESILKGEEVSMSPKAASVYSNIDYVKATGENREKVETFVEKQQEKAVVSQVPEKNSKAGPKGKK